MSEKSVESIEWDNSLKIYILQHKKDENIFVRSLNFGSAIEELTLTNDINRAERFFSRGASLRIYRAISKGEVKKLKEELKNYKLVEVDIVVQIKGKEFEQVQFDLGGIA